MDTDKGSNQTFLPLHPLGEWPGICFHPCSSVFIRGLSDSTAEFRFNGETAFLPVAFGGVDVESESLPVTVWMIETESAALAVTVWGFDAGSALLPASVETIETGSARLPCTVKGVDVELNIVPLYA